MSEKGNCDDNAPMESFWGTMKNELVYREYVMARAELEKEMSTHW
jgi:transposase InsO family protein